MEIPNYDFNEDETTNFKQLYKYMPKSNFRMLICNLALTQSHFSSAFRSFLIILPSITRTMF